MRCVILVALFLASLAAAAPRWNELEGYTFKHYVADFGRVYSGEEYSRREKQFNENLAEIRSHNSDKTQSYKKGVNHFSDWSKKEFKAYNTLRFEDPAKGPKADIIHSAKAGAKPSDYPKTVDYRLNNAPRVLTGIKNQGACGGCWGFSATESMESYFALLTGQLPVLSAQQIISCTTLMDGCGGGLQSYGWKYVQNSTGLNEEWLYPFTDFFVKNETMKATAKCLNITEKFLPMFSWYPKAGVTGYARVEANSAISTIDALATIGPHSISVAASLWMSYEGGIYHNNGTNPANWEIDHAVQLVGYGFDFDLAQNYWIVRNSWGTEWGEAGFIRLARPAVEPCGQVPGANMTACGTSAVLSAPDRPIVSELKKKNA